MTPRGQRLDLRRCLLLDADGYDFQAGFPRCFEREHREAAATGDQSVRHVYLMKPRSEVRMNSSSSVTSDTGSTSAAIRSRACDVLRPERVSKRNALCSASMFAAGKFRRLRPVAFA